MRYDIKPVDREAARECKMRWDAIAKPLDSLGLLEEYAAKIAAIRASADIRSLRKCALVFCADNGVVAEGVTQTGSDVTAAVAKAIASGTSNISAMARVAGADVFAVDMGMNEKIGDERIIDRRIAAGTANIAKGPAMTREMALSAINSGIDMVGWMKSRGYDIIATGEMGIGNTTTSSALAAVLLKKDVMDVTGRGAGLTDEGLARKRAVISRAIAVNRPDPSDAADVLSKLGGFDIAGMAGAFLGGGVHRVPIVIDGFISSVAALVAYRIAPMCREYMLSSHLSRESACIYALDELGLKAPINARMSLGEGTGAVALFPLLDMALSVYNSGHTFEGINVEAYTRQGAGS